MKIRLCLLGVMVTIAAQPAAAQSKFEREITWLEKWLKVGKGSVLADVGAGDGEFAIALSRAVGEAGRVYATELEEDERAEIEQAAREAQAPQVEVMPARIEGTGLPEACCDGVLLRGVYHHLTAPESFARSLYATVRPGGRLAIIDFPPTFWLALWTPKGIPENRGGHGITPELVASELEAAGFVQLESVERWPSYNFFTRNYGLLFERPAEDMEKSR